MKENILVGFLIGLLLLGLILIWWDLLGGKNGRKQRLKTGIFFLRPQFLASICLGISLLIFFSLLHFSSLQATIWFVSLAIILVLIKTWREKRSDIIYKKPVFYLPLIIVSLIIAFSLLLIRPFGLLPSIMALLAMGGIAGTGAALQTDFLPRKNVAAYRSFSLLSGGIGIIILLDQPFFNILSYIIGFACIAYGIFCFSLVPIIKQQ